MVLSNIIGRSTEIGFLETIWDSGEAEFVAVYGRRRVGKTHLVREYFSSRGEYFELTGLKDGSLQDQLANFAQAFTQAFCVGKTFRPPSSLQSPKDWREAFEWLTEVIESHCQQKKMVLFFDELPWLATKRSAFIQNLDYFWNTRWSKLGNLKLIVCGSAASWMLDNLINAKGGLYNRLTNTLLLKPYSLAQMKLFLASRNIKLSHKQLLDIYIVTGGIPHYLKRIQKGKSAAQNINDLCFMHDGLLLDEFPRLFESLFENAEVHLQIVREIAKARYGLSAKLLSERLGKKTGGTLTNKLAELTAAGFIEKYCHYGKTKRDQYYRVIDEYSFFYLSWIEPYKTQDIVGQRDNYWQLATKTAAWHSWAGYAFESVCYKHIQNILQAMQLGNTHCRVGQWRYLPNKSTAQEGAQIDLIIERDDGMVSLCEIKYSDKLLLVDKKLAKNLLNKVEVYQTQFPMASDVNLAMVTTVGVKKNAWSSEMIDQQVTLDDLFK